MDRKSQHVIHSPKGGWSVVRSGAAKASRTFPTQQEAIDFATHLGREQSTDVFVHSRDGTVSSREDFGSARASAKR